jgi:hypothetical protein
MNIFGGDTWGAAPQALISALQTITSTIGFVYVVYQIIQVRNTLRGATQDRLYVQYNEICKTFMQKPYLREYFYESRSFNPDQSDREYLRSEIDVMCEMILALIEHSVLQQSNMPKDAWEHCWHSYARERVKQSVEMRRFFESNSGWYATALGKLVKNLINENNVAKTA